MLRWLLIIIGIAIGSFVLMALIGLLLPAAHVASASLYLRQSPDSVWAVIRDIGGYAAWWDEIESVERAPTSERELWLQQHRRAGVLPLEVVESQPTQRLITRIAGADLPFRGTWTHVIDPAPGGCTLTITESGEVYNPLFRFVSRYVFGHHATLEAYLEALAARFGDGAPVTRLP